MKEIVLFKDSLFIAIQHLLTSASGTPAGGKNEPNLSRQTKEIWKDSVSIQATMSTEQKQWGVAL